jgi:dynein heavy chain
MKKNEERHLVRCFLHMHSSALELAAQYLREEKRTVYITPSMFIDLVRALKSFYHKLRNKSETKSQMYTNGVDKITETQKVIDNMKDMLEKKKPELQQMNQELAEFQKIIDAKEEELKPIFEKVCIEEAKVNVEFQKSDALRRECEEELKAVNIIFEEAQEAIKTIGLQDLFAVKSYTSPPMEVKMVMSSICIILNRKPDTDKSGKADYWPAAKLLLGEGTRLLAKLNSLSEKDLNQKSMNKVRQEYLTNPKFTPKLIEKVSKPAAAFCKWVLAADKMEDAFRKVLPKREKMQAAEATANKMKEALSKIQLELSIEQQKINDLNNEKQENERKRKELEDEIKLTQIRYDRANILINSLSEEKISWEEKLELMKKKLPLMMGDCLLSAGVLIYLGPFSGSYRNKEIERWIQFVASQKIIFSEKFSLEDSMGDPMEMRKWTMKGLPNDSISREKGLTVYRTQKVPLIIDPQSQANKWIKNVEKDRDLVVTRLDKDDFMRSLEKALTFGKPLLIESVPEDIDPVIYPILSKQTFKHATAGLSIKIGDNVFEYHANFRCIMTTKLSNPAFQPEVTCKACLVNFMITKEGLEDQLLELTVSKERPDLEESRIKIIEVNHTNNVKMEEIENEILTTLKNVEGNILDNEDAINTLKRSNIVSSSIKEKQKTSIQNEILNEEARKVYRKLAYHGMILFFCTQSLTKINKTYEYSLSWYSKMYLRAIESSEKSTFVEQRIDNVSEQLNLIIYSNVCRGLYEKDKLIFSLLLAIALMRKEYRINEKQLQFFVSPFDYIKFKDEKSKVEWMSDTIWKKTRSVEAIEGRFSVLADRIATSPGAWENFYSHPKPEEMELPEPFEEATDLERLILLKIFRPEAVVKALKKFVQNSIGKEFIKSPAFDIEISFDESSSSLPLIFLLPGIAPLTALEGFAIKYKCEDLKKISLGQGQDRVAEEAIKNAKLNGYWVMLENCHLYPSWMPKLAQICEDLADPSQEGNIHAGFRLWLTTYPSEDFPMTVLQNSIKMSNEPPEGLSTNLELSYKSLPLSDMDFFENHHNPTQFKTLIYSLCLFHSIIQERRSFGSIGWNIYYDFNMSDLRVSLLNLKEFTKGNPNNIPFKALYYMIGECNYGGRVTDYHDRRLLQTLLQDVLSHKVLYSGHHFFDIEEYEVPPVGTYNSYLEFISKLPLEQPPELYGLHNNALISKAVQDTDVITKKLIGIVGTPSSAFKEDGGSGDEEEKAIAPILELKNKIPSRFIEKMVSTKYPVLYEESMNTVLQQEVARFNRLIDRIIFSLSQLVDALKGDIVMSNELEEMAESINQKRIPKIWLEVSYPSLKPLASYIDDLSQRIDFFNRWIEEGIPKLFWISGFFFTQSFLTGVSQNYARKYKVSIDQLDYSFEFGYPITEDVKTTEEKLDRPNDGCYIYGLYFEGCAWDANDKRLIECRGRETMCPAPIILILPTEEKRRDSRSEYHCPVYKTMERKGVLSTTGHSTNYILSIDVYTDLDPKTWIKRGVALICQLSE